VAHRWRDWVVAIYYSYKQLANDQCSFKPGDSIKLVPVAILNRIEFRVKFGNDCEEASKNTCSLRLRRNHTCLWFHMLLRKGLRTSKETNINWTNTCPCTDLSFPLHLQLDSFLLNSVTLEMISATLFGRSLGI